MPSGELVSVSEYDDLNVYKNGQCYELANGEVRQVCVYEMDRLHRRDPGIQRCHDDRIQRQRTESV